MKLAEQPAITLTLHQLQRLVRSYYDIDTWDLDRVAGAVFEGAELCAETGCEPCAEWLATWAQFRHDSEKAHE